MKKQLLSISVGLCAIMLLNGCVAVLGNRGSAGDGPTLGKQLVGLQKAKESGAISDAEFESQKARLLSDK